MGAKPARITDPDLVLIWRHTHRDYRGVFEDGTRTIMIGGAPGGGSQLVGLDDIPEPQRSEHLAYAKRREATRLQAKREALQ